MVLSGTKAYEKQQEIKEIVAVSHNFYKRPFGAFKTMKQNVKQTYIFHLILSLKTGGGVGFFLLNESLILFVGCTKTFICFELRL